MFSNTTILINTDSLQIYSGICMQKNTRAWFYTDMQNQQECIFMPHGVFIYVSKCKETTAQLRLLDSLSQHVQTKSLL